MRKIYTFTYEGLEYEFNVYQIECIIKTYDKGGSISKVLVKLASGFEFSINKKAEIENFFNAYNLI